MKMTELGFDILFNSVHPNVFSSFLSFEVTVHLTVAHQVLRRPTGYTEVLLHRTVRLPSFTSHSHTLKAPRTALGFKGVRYPLLLAWHNSGYSGKAHQQERQGVESKVGCTYLMALLGVHSGGRSPGQELRTHLLGGADPCNTASSQESAENVFSL